MLWCAVVHGADLPLPKPVAAFSLRLVPFEDNKALFAHMTNDAWVQERDEGAQWVNVGHVYHTEKRVRRRPGTNVVPHTTTRGTPIP